MNLNTDPVEKLAELLSSCDDNAGHHVVWVDPVGSVHITLLGESQAPSDLDRKAMFRLETFHRGGGYVGLKASLSRGWVKELHDWLFRAYRDGERGYVDC